VLDDVQRAHASFIAKLRDEKASIADLASTAAGKGLDMVGFIQSGDGAVPRIAQAKAREAVSVNDFGADPTGVADSAAAITLAVTKCIATGSTLTGEGTYKLLSTANLRFICVNMPNATFVIAHAGIGLIIGSSANGGNAAPQHIGSVTRTVGTDSTTTPTVRCIGAKGQHITVEYAPYFQVYANTATGVATTDSSTAYSTFNLKFSTTVELTNNAATDGTLTQWINENFFYLNRVFILLINGTYSHNHNYFYGGTFEGGAIINIDKGYQNYIRDIRQEGALAVTFGTLAKDNIITIGWSSDAHRYPSDGVTVTNNGSMNAVQHNFDTYASTIPLAGFGYETLKKVGANYNVIGAQALTVGVSDLTVGSWTDIYVSPLIPVDGENTIFEVNLYGAGYGGVRMKINGYDSAKALITPASGQVEYDGAGVRMFDELDSGVNDARWRRFFITSPSCKFAKITILSAGAGAQFDAFLLTARVANIALRDKMHAYINTTNNFV
jgi:hypothetical protein